MAIHDYVIDNQSAPAFRADLNNALQAIVSQNSSASAPTTTYANMFWYDTASNQLKKRNEANSAWVTLGTIDEALGIFTPSGGPVIATQAEAEAGTDNTKMMTPLRSKQAIAALSPDSTVLLGILNTTSGSSQTLSGLNLTTYSQVCLVINSVSTNAGTSVLRLDAVGGPNVTGELGNGANKWFGICWIDLTTGVYASSTAAMSISTGALNGYSGTTSIRNTSTSISLFTGSVGVFDLGQVLIYGVR